MSKNKKETKYCNCHVSSDKAILKSEAKHSFCNKCGCVLLKSKDGTIYYTLKTKQKRLPYDLSPISIIKHMKKKTEDGYPYIYEEFNINKSDKYTKEKTVKSINIYLKFRKMLLLKLQKLMKTFDYCDMVFYQTLFYLDNYLSHIMTEDMTEKTVLYYLVGFFLCAVKFKETDIYEPSLDSFFDLSKGNYLSMERIAYYEVLCLKTIDYNVFSYSAYDWISQLVSNGIIFNCEINNNTEVILIKGHRHSLVNTINKYAVKLLLNITFKNLFFKYPPMYIAFSLVQIAREKYIDSSMIREKLFAKLIKLYGIKFEDYKKCYEEIVTEMKEANEESDKDLKEKVKERKNSIKNISDKNLPDLREREGNENSNTHKKGKNIYVPNKIRSSNVLVHMKDNPIENSPNNKENVDIEDIKENENKGVGAEFELSLNEVVGKKKFKIKSQKDTIKALNPAERRSIDLRNNIFKIKDSLSKIDIKTKVRHSFAIANEEENPESNHSRNISLTKNKNRPVLKELAHVKTNTNRHHSITNKNLHINLNIPTSVEKEKDYEDTNKKRKSKFFTNSNKDMDKLNIEKKRKNIYFSTKLPILNGIENFNIDGIDANFKEQNINKDEPKTKKLYKLKKNIDNIKLNNTNENETKVDKSTKKLIEVL